MVREGDFYFQNNIKFFQGGGSRLPPRSVLDGAHWAPGPPCTPKGVLSSGSPFYFVFLGSGACLPLWGRRCPVGTILRRSPLPRPSVLDGAHWAPGPEPAGETVPPKAAEGVFRGKERAGKSKKSPSLLRAGGRCAGMVHPRGRWGPMPGSPLMGGRAL